MKRKTIKWIVIILLGGFLFACSGVKSVARQEMNLTGEVEVDKKELRLEEQKQMEFQYLFMEALKEKALGNLQRAVQMLSGCLEIDPNSSAAMYELASLHAANNDFASASLLLEKAISINPENRWYHLFLAQIYQQSRRFGDAASTFDRLLQQEPENLEYLFMKAGLLTNSGQIEEALNTYDVLEEIMGINEQISVAKQQLYLEDEQVEKALEEIRKLIDFNPLEPKYYGLLADLYQHQGDTENALKYYLKIQEIDPDNGFVHFSLANHYRNIGDAKRSFEETKMGFQSEDADLQTKLQLFLMLTGSQGQSDLTPEQEVELIDILLEIHPGEYLVHTISAESLLKKGKLEEARTTLLKAIQMEKNDYVLWERVLFIDNDLQDWQSLYEHSAKAMDFFPNQPQVYFLHAIGCLQLEKYDEAIAISEEGLLYVMENNRLKSQLLMLNGEALYKLNRKSEAFEIFDRVVEMDPENYIALNNYAYYLSLAGKNLDKAERMSGKVIERFPENATYLDTYAWVLFKKGEYKLARFYMESALQNSGEDNPTLLEHYGDILFKLQQPDKAVEYWLKSKELGESTDILERKIRERNYFEE